METPSDNTCYTPTSSHLKAAVVAILLEHPRLTHTEPEEICSFLRRYDQYSTTVLARARQMTAGSITMEDRKPVDLTGCVDVEFLESNIALVFIIGAPTYEYLINAHVRSFLESR